MRRAGESSSFLRRAARFDLGSLPSYEVEEAVRITIESAGRTISQPALDAAVQAIGGLGSGNAPALPQPRARARLRGGFGAGSRGGVREGRPARCELNGSSRLSAVDARHIRGLSTVESTILGPPACLCASSRRILGAGTVDSTPIRPVFAKTASTRGTQGSQSAGNRRLELRKRSIIRTDTGFKLLSRTPLDQRLVRDNGRWKACWPLGANWLQPRGRSAQRPAIRAFQRSRRSGSNFRCHPLGLALT